MKKQNLNQEGLNFLINFHKFSINDYKYTLKDTIDNEKYDFKEIIVDNLNKTGDLKKL